MSPSLFLRRRTIASLLAVLCGTVVAVACTGSDGEKGEPGLVGQPGPQGPGGLPGTGGAVDGGGSILTGACT